MKITKRFLLTLALAFTGVLASWAEDEVTLTPTATANEWTLQMPDADVELEVTYFTDEELAEMEEAAFTAGVELTDNGDGTWTLASMPAFDVELEVEYYTDEELNQMAADEVIVKINAIGEVEYTDASKALIDAAREAYNALTDAQKALVSAETLKVLTDAETAYAELEAAALAVTLTDDVAYTQTSDKEVGQATYLKTLDENRVGKHQAWLVPFDYTITDDDLLKFSFYKINMIANAPDTDTDATDQMWVFLKKMKAGDVLRANMPYTYIPQTAVTDFEFTTLGATLKARNTGVLLKTETTETVYSFYANYEETKATAESPFYYVDINGNLSLGNNGTVTVGAFRWILRAESKHDGDPGYVRTFRFIDDDDMATGISLNSEASTEDEANVYDLSGRRVTQPTKSGVYIVNGRKVVIK